MLAIVLSVILGGLGWVMFNAMGIKPALMTISMVAVGVLAFRLLQRQEGGTAFPSDDEEDHQSSPD